MFHADWPLDSNLAWILPLHCLVAYHYTVFLHASKFWIFYHILERCSCSGDSSDPECPMIQDASSTCIRQKGKNCGEIKRKGCSINAPTPTNNACWPPRYTHPRITWFRPSLCCNGTSLQAGSRLPAWYDAPVHLHATLQVATLLTLAMCYSQNFQELRSGMMWHQPGCISLRWDLQMLGRAPIQDFWISN